MEKTREGVQHCKAQGMQGPGRTAFSRELPHYFPQLTPNLESSSLRSTAAGGNLSCEELHFLFLWKAYRPMWMFVSLPGARRLGGGGGTAWRWRPQESEQQALRAALVYGGGLAVPAAGADVG